MQPNAWYEKHAWIFFALVGTLGVIMSVQFMLSPTSVLSLFAEMGHPVPGSLQEDAGAVAFLAFLISWTGGSLLGVNLLTVFIAATAFRAGQRWSWYAMWYWPLLFLTHLFAYSDPFMQGVQVFWAVSSVLLLAANFKRMVLSQRSPSHTQAAA